ncbi:MAG TPA: DNA gyrase inhibitor YacG [Rhodoferax sp.]|nr:DNA gyrase inhibitor YacG [Rhodoferax sp.]HNV58258.1 DNA gyrase inhibitor YacG [Rhodoferax sp.]HPW29197.1 DNA gyrase inhibitor YacG [Rhodoferax sp.]
MVDRIVRCPTCGGDSVYGLSNIARPFCSDRCKNMDFGAWASENFRVAAPATSIDIEPGEPRVH